MSFKFWNRAALGDTSWHTSDFSPRGRRRREAFNGAVECWNDCDNAVAENRNVAQRLAWQEALLRHDDVGPRREHPAGSLQLVVVEESEHIHEDVVRHGVVERDSDGDIL